MSIDEKLMEELQACKWNSWGALLLHVRSYHHLSRGAIAAKLRYDRRYCGFVRDVEEDVVRPSQDMLRRYRKFFSLDGRYLVQQDLKFHLQRAYRLTRSRAHLIGGSKGLRSYDAAWWHLTRTSPLW